MLYCLRPVETYMALALAGRSDEPLRDLNTTPLIDVLHVILVMLILSNP